MSAVETVEHKHTIIIAHKPQPASIGNVCYGAVATGRRCRKACVIGEDGTAGKEEVRRSGHMTRKHQGCHSCDVFVDFCDVFAHLILFSILTCWFILPDHLFSLHLVDSLFSLFYFFPLMWENIMIVKKWRNYV